MDSPVETVVVVTGSAPLDPSAVDAVPAGAVVVAADGGLDHGRAAGIDPDVIVGDLDSVSAAGLAWASANADVRAHSADKLVTDTELAIEHAVTLRPQRLMLVAGAGDRLDHAIAALGALGASAVDGVRSVEAWWGGDHLIIARPGRPAVVDRPAGTTFSVLAMHGPCRGVSIAGARWSLAADDLGPLVGRGVSNQVLVRPVSVGVDHGVLTIIIPGAQPS